MTIDDPKLEATELENAHRHLASVVDNVVHHLPTGEHQALKDAIQSVQDAYEASHNPRHMKLHIVGHGKSGDIQAAWHWQLRARNGEILGVSETFNTKHHAVEIGTKAFPDVPQVIDEEPIA